MEYRYMIKQERYDIGITTMFMRDLQYYIDDINAKFGVPVAFHNGYVCDIDLSGLGELMTVILNVYGMRERASGTMRAVAVSIRPLNETDILVEVMDEERERNEFQIVNLNNYSIKEAEYNGRIVFDIAMTSRYQEIRIIIDPVNWEKVKKYAGKVGHVALETAPYWLPLVL